MDRGLVVVSGAGHGIGRAVATLAGRAGYRVGLLDIDEPAAVDVAALAYDAGAPGAVGVGCDVTDEVQVAEKVDAIVAELATTPTGLVAAAGIDVGGPVHALDPSAWRRVLEVNLTGSFLVAQAVLRHLVDGRTPGSLVLCSSPAASVAFSAGGTSAYAASKGGVSSLVRTLAIDYASYGIRVNAVVPGPTETSLMWAGVPERDRPRLRDVVHAEVPLGRLASPDEPAKAAMYLLGPDSSYVTGSSLVCDGGVLAKGSISV